MKNAVLKAILVAAIGGAATAAPEALEKDGKKMWQHAALGALVGVAALFTEKPRKTPAKPSRRAE